VHLQAVAKIQHCFYDLKCIICPSGKGEDDDRNGLYGDHAYLRRSDFYTGCPILFHYKVQREIQKKEEEEKMISPSSNRT
jgi:hypothetical protein